MVTKNVTFHSVGPFPYDNTLWDAVTTDGRIVVLQVAISTGGDVTTPLLIGGSAATSTLTIKSTTGVGTTDAIIFQVGNNGATEAMRVIDSGNVGIGTTNPGTLLQLANTGKLSWVQSGGDEVNAGKIDYRGFDAQALSIVGAGTSATNRIVRVFDNLSVGYGLSAGALTGGQAVLSGSVGIGTTGPGAPLHISKSATGLTEVLRLMNGNTVAGDGPSVEFWWNSGSPNRGAAIGINPTAAATADLLFQTGNGAAPATRMTIKSDGTVGIGTTSPSTALDVVSTTGAFIPPRMTTTQRDALTATNGMLIYNTTTDAYNYRKAGVWTAI